MEIRQFFWNLFDPRIGVWGTVQSCQAIYECYQQPHPDMDRTSFSGVSGMPPVRCGARQIILTFTNLLSLRPIFTPVFPPDGAKALGLWIVSNARPGIIERAPCLAEDYYRLICPRIPAAAERQAE